MFLGGVRRWEGETAEAGRLRAGVRGDPTSVHGVRHAHLRGARNTRRNRLRFEDRRVGRRCDPIHPPVRLSTVRVAG